MKMMIEDSKNYSCLWKALTENRSSSWDFSLFWRIPLQNPTLHNKKGKRKGRFMMMIFDSSFKLVCSLGLVFNTEMLKVLESVYMNYVKLSICNSYSVYKRSLIPRLFAILQKTRWYWEKKGGTVTEESRRHPAHWDWVGTKSPSLWKAPPIIECV